jgi:hypothetical protein
LQLAPGLTPGVFVYAKQRGGLSNFLQLLRVAMPSQCASSQRANASRRNALSKKLSLVHRPLQKNTVSAGSVLPAIFILQNALSLYRELKCTIHFLAQASCARRGVFNSTVRGCFQ